MKLVPDFVNGYFEAQGSFDIQFKVAKKEIEVRIIMSIHQGSGSKEIMTSLATFFQRDDTYVPTRRKKLVYETQDRKHHRNVVSVHFNKHPLKSTIHQNFLKFERALSISENRRLLTTEEGQRLTKDELRELVDLSYSMNVQPNINSRYKKPKEGWLKRIDSL
jgi:hypothetical protein